MGGIVGCIHAPGKINGMDTFLISLGVQPPKSIYIPLDKGQYTCDETPPKTAKWRKLKNKDDNIHK